MNGIQEVGGSIPLGSTNPRSRGAAIARRKVLLRALALAGVAVAASACRHLSAGADTDAKEYDSMLVSPPTPPGGGAGASGGM